MAITTKFIKQFRVEKYIAIIAASFYDFSPIYFRHTIYWEFFSDAMIWLPIILLGVEKIFENKRGWVFALGVACTLFNNGYFAYYNLLISAIYIVIRLFIKFYSNESDRKKVIIRLIVYGIVGLLISLPGFIPFVKGFMDSIRLSTGETIALFDQEKLTLDNLLYSDNIQITPALALYSLFYLRNYKNKIFLFMASFTVVLIILRYSPFVASVFNGFSDPQYRWHYITYLFIAVTIGLGLQFIKGNFSWVNCGISFMIVIGMYYYSFGNEYSSKKLFIMYLLCLTICLLFICLVKSIHLKFLIMCIT